MLTKEWSIEHLRNHVFAKRLFYTSLTIRLVYVVFSYGLYIGTTGIPFEPDAADSYFYHTCALAGSDILGSGGIWHFWHDFQAFMCMEISDTGYAAYLSIVYFLTDNSIIVSRLIKAILSALTVFFMYRLSVRNFGEQLGRVVGIFCMLMPNLIYYCGLHLKEVEMVFLTVWLVDQADLMLRSRKLLFGQVFLVLLIGAALFTMRTVLALVALLAVLFTIVLASNKVMNWAKRLIVGLLATTLVTVTVGNRIQENAKELVEIVQSGTQKGNMEWRAKRDNGNKFAEFAGAAVFAPLIFTIPFPTVVDIPEQDFQKMINGGNYVKNILSVFVIFAVVMLVISGDWRKYPMPLSFLLGYLVVLVFSDFAQSERFHQPVMPFELMFAAYALPLLEKKHKRWYNYWLIGLFVVIVFWQWFKLAGRNMI